MVRVGRTPDEAADWRLLRVIDQYKEFHRSGCSAAACVSSSGLAYVHEYLSLDAAGVGPTVRVVVLRRPCEEVVASFMRKTTDRNHWQHPDDWTADDRRRWKRDKTWDRMFPDMTLPPKVSGAGSTTLADANQELCSPLDDEASPLAVWGKPEAIRAYWQLYYTVVDSLTSRFPERVRISAIVLLSFARRLTPTMFLGLSTGALL